MIKYRKEIDGLRAIAILPVIWSHSGLPYLKGGYIGVDVFFVISGFLITSILLGELNQGSFSLTRFYERRARRILPALIVVITLTSISVPMISQHPKFLSDYGSSVLSTVLFSSNIYFWQTSGYFGSTSELAPLLHTWSLAVEEQFYILFPLFMFAIFQLGKRVLIGALVVISFTSLAVAEWGAVNYPIANFYLLPTRAWELLLGAVGAIIFASSFFDKIERRASNALSIFGMFLILGSYYFFSPSTLHPTKFTILPTLGTLLVLIFAKKDNLAGRVLSLKALTGIGLISYSLYLWHQPVLALLKNHYTIHLSIQVIFFAVLLIFILSFLTWRFVETPFRNKSTFNTSRIFKYSIASLIFVGFLGLIFKSNVYIQNELYPEDIKRYKELLTADNDHSSQEMISDRCKFWSDEFDNAFVSNFDSCVSTYDKAIFITGGSHGMDLYNAVAKNTSFPFVVSVSRGYCRPYKYIGTLSHEPACHYEDLKKFLSHYSKNISHVFYTQTPVSLSYVKPLSVAKQDDISLDAIDTVVDYLFSLKSEYNLSVTMIGMLPPLTISPINWDYTRPFESQTAEIISYEAIGISKYIDDLFETRLGIHNIPYVTKFDSFGLSYPKSLFQEGTITYSDYNHISEHGENIFGQQLIQHLYDLGYSELEGK